MRKFIKHLLKHMLAGLGFMFSAMIVIALCIWFVTLDFPQEMFSFDIGFRKFALFVLGLSAFVGFVKYDKRTKEQVESDEKALINHLSRENTKLKMILEANKSVIIQNMAKTQSSNKTTAVDIALGVGAGIVGAEIVSDFLDL